MRQRILIVEDDAGIARLLLDNLTIDGFDVRWVANAHEALVACQEFVPALVVLDVMLPDRVVTVGSLPSWVHDRARQRYRPDRQRAARASVAVPPCAMLS
jgi:CheY-like chemotaxis protein